jgi:hypothetical protein
MAKNKRLTQSPTTTTKVCSPPSPATIQHGATHQISIRVVTQAKTPGASPSGTKPAKKAASKVS